MPRTTSRPKGAPWVTPYVTVEDVEKAVAFYEKAFNFERKEMAPGEDGTTWHAEMLYKDQLIMFGKQGAWGSTTKTPNNSNVESPMNLYLYCEDVDAFYKHAMTAGAKSLNSPEDMFWGDRMCRIADPEGYVWCFATHLGSRT